MLRVLIFILMFIVVQSVQALTFMSINTEWFWDELEPHEGQIAVGPVGHGATKSEVDLEAFAIATLIQFHDADVVGLIEVEGDAVVDRIQAYLPNGWTSVFRKGRDNFTGQDVALLTRIPVIAGTANNLANAEKGTSVDGTVEAKPSKVLAVGLDDQGTTYFVMVTHLISKRSTNDKKREAQAHAIRKVVVDQMPNFNHIVVMGDLNDLPGSSTLKRIRGLDDTSPDLAQSAVTTGTDRDFSYVFQGEHQLIDHILVSSSIATNADFRSVDLGPISDHRAVLLSTQ